MENLSPHRTIIRAEILAAATEDAKAAGLYNMRRNRVADRAGVANGLVNNYFGTLDALRDEVVREAIRHERTDIIAMALAARDPIVSDIPPELRQRVAKSMAGI